MAETVKGKIQKLIDDGIYASSFTSNPTATHARPNDTNAYTALDVIGSNPAVNLTFANIVSVNGGGFFIVGASLEIDVNAIPSGMSTFKLHLYNVAPTAIADNVAFNLPSADRTKYLGYITLNTPIDLGDTLWSQNDNLNFKHNCASDSRSIYGLLQTVGAYTPSAQAVKIVTLKIMQA